ncbi:MAG TPA: hypothetical protein VN766_00355 [Stellaceae bacterium]|jgi:hypothetical protein|nr:hypothetical protein [Stellaceae bacterium]
MTGIGFAQGRLGAVVLLALAPLLAGCGHSSSSDKSAEVGSAAADAQSELRREQDCANAEWKAANPGLYYNLCPNNPLR